MLPAYSLHVSLLFWIVRRGARGSGGQGLVPEGVNRLVSQFERARYLRHQRVQTLIVRGILPFDSRLVSCCLVRDGLDCRLDRGQRDTSADQRQAELTGGEGREGRAALFGCGFGRRVVLAFPATPVAFSARCPQP